MRSGLPGNVLPMRCLLMGCLLLGGVLPGAGAPREARAQVPSDLSGFAGRWQINLAKSRLGRAGPNGKYVPRGPLYSYVYTLVGGDLRMDVYEKGVGAPLNRSTTVVLDARERLSRGACAGVGNASRPGHEETQAFFPVDAHVFVRVVRVNGRVTEYFTTSLAADGKSMTHILWSPETPEWQNVYVYDRQP